MQSKFVKSFSLRCKVKGATIEVVVIRQDDNAIEMHHIHSALLAEKPALLGLPDNSEEFKDELDESSDAEGEEIEVKEEDVNGK